MNKLVDFSWIEGVVYFFFYINYGIISMFEEVFSFGIMFDFWYWWFFVNGLYFNDFLFLQDKDFYQIFFGFEFFEKRYLGLVFEFG